MKKQINPNIKAHLSRGAFYFILLIGVCLIPFALAQRATTRQSAVAGQLPSGSIGTVNETYSSSADTGPNFRIDSCQYVYNLSSSALGVGTYRIDIKISGQVVGSATVHLK